MFENKFGLEAGINISTKNVDLRFKDSGKKGHAFIDSFSFPFLLQTKLLYPQNPFRKLNFFLGTTIEYQRFIEGSEHLRVLDKLSGFVPNLSIGSSISYRKGSLGKLELGVFFNYALKSYYSYLLQDTQTNTSITTTPVAHYLKFELRYFFINFESKSKAGGVDI